MTGARFDQYDWPGGREAMLRFGPERGPTVIAAMPLFEEANRTRAAVVDVLRRLAALGIGGALPDLPGTGESLVATKDAMLADWRAAFAAAAAAAAAAALPGPVYVMAWRGGALVDAEARVASRWWLAPVDGADVMRDLRRAQAMSGDEALFAGNALSARLIGELETATLPNSVRPELVEGRPTIEVGLPVDSSGRTSTSSVRTDFQIRTVRLETDPRPADAILPGRPLWRAAEPGTDEVLQKAIADDIAQWIATCEG